MSRFLCFWLHGPLCSWGETAVGEVRSSQGHPTKSAVLGLTAGALGIDRFDQPAHDALHRGLDLAVLTIAPGRPLRDFQTVSPPRRIKGLVHATRRDEALALDEKDSAIVSERHYYCDAHYIAALRRRPGAACPSLEKIAQALDRPVYTPYLGRKSCPPSLPLAPRIVEAVDAARALRDHLAHVQGRAQTHGLAPKVPSGALSLMVDDHADLLEPADGDQVFTVRDADPQRGRWQFGLRRERRRSLAWPEARKE